MNLHASARDELHTLVESLFEEQLDDAGRDRLAELLAGSEEAQWLYIREMNLHAGLAWDAGTFGENDECGMMNDGLAADAPAARSPLGIHPSSFIFHQFTSLAGSALFCYTLAVLILGVGLLAARQWPATGGGTAGPAGQLTVQAPPTFDVAKAACVGRVTAMSAGCHWADPKSLGPDPDRLLVGREILLPEGAMLELTYEAGIRVVLEGPATYLAESADKGYLEFGKATVRVGPERRRGAPARKSVFWLHTRAADLVNRGGGEFAVFTRSSRAENTALAYMEVFRGELRVGLPSKDDDAIVLDSSSPPAYVTVDAKRVLLYYGNRQLSPTIFARQLPKETSVYTRGDEKKPAAGKGAGLGVPNS